MIYYLIIIETIIVDLQIYIKTINNFGFDYDYLKKYTPYCINIRMMIITY